MLNILFFLLLIGPLIFIHELGHLLAAKLVDVKATRFSIGFGPPLARFSLGETEYWIAPIPLGGYVQLLGQNPHEEVEPADAERSLTDKPLWARVFVLLAGPLANLILPFIIYFFFFIGHAVQSPPVVGTVLDDSAAAAAELEPGDRIVSIAGRDIRSWTEMQEQIGTRPEQEVLVQIEREGRRFDRYLIPRRLTYRDALGVQQSRGLLGIYPYFYAPQVGIIDSASAAGEAALRTGDIITSINGEPVRLVEEIERLERSRSDSAIRVTYLRPVAVPGPLGTFLYYQSAHAQLRPRKEREFSTGLLPANTFLRDVEVGSPADAAGLRAGDRILAIDGREVTRWETIASALDRAQTEPVTMRVQSPDQAPREVTVEQQIRKIKDVYLNEHPFLWAGAVPYRSLRFPEPEPIRGRFAYAADAAWRQTTAILWAMGVALRQMVTLERGVDDLGSVVGIYYYAGIAAEQGPGEFMRVMAFISLSLGFVNLLPIPILDGGHILFYTIEGIRRRPMGQRAREIAATVGLVVLGLLMLVAFRNDIVRFWFR